MKRVKNFFAYIYFLPLSLILALLISGTVCILQNIFNYISCTFTLVPTWFLSNYTACNGVYNKRTFLADVAFCFILIKFIELFIPSYSSFPYIVA